MRPVLLGLGTFAAAFLSPALLVAYVLTSDAGRASRTDGDDFALAAYLASAAVVGATIAYAAVTAASSTWRQMRVGRAVRISLTVGVIAFCLHISGVIFLLLAPVYAMFRAWPAGRVATGFLAPGIFSGLLAVSWARLRRGH